MTNIPFIGRLTAGGAAALVAVALAGSAFAQAPATTKPAPAAKPAAQAPAAAPAQGAAPGAPAEEPKFSASPWQKICQEIPENKKQVCVLSQVLGVENQAIAKVDLIEVKDEARRRLTIAVPLGMRLQPGMRITLDKDPISVPFVICQPMPGGGATCIGEAEVNADFVGKMKKANAIYLQMMNGQGRTLSLPISNSDFTKVYDGPGVDAKVAMEQERKRMEEAQAAKAAQDEQGKAALLKKGQELERAKAQGAAPK